VSPESLPLTTLTLFGPPPSQRAWAFARRSLARPALARVSGLRFWRLLGTGGNGGMGPRADWSLYGLLVVWDSAGATDAVFADSALMQVYRPKFRASPFPFPVHEHRRHPSW
jgi:hypothetical protein